MEKLICIRKVVKDGVTDLDFQRLPKSAAEKLVATGDYTYTSKGKYRRYLASLEPKFRAGIPFSSIKDGKKTRTHNNRKSTRGRKLVYFDITIRIIPQRFVSKMKNIVKRIRERNFTIATSDKGFVLHKAIKHLVSIDPITGKKIYTKEGKGVEVEFIPTIKKGDLILDKPKTRMKNITKDEAHLDTPKNKKGKG